MANRYQTLVSGESKLVEATVTSAGAGDAGEIVALDGSGRLDPSVMPVGIGADVKVLATSENLAAGDYVNIYDDSGTPKARLADQSNGRPAHGFTKAATTSPANATIYFEGSNSDLSGLTPGARQYLGTVGSPTETPQTTGLHQFLGIAISATEINTDIDDHVVL
jgi:hypothetical protein